MTPFESVKEIVGQVLQLGDRINDFTPETALLGSVPEFDSMVVVAVITAIEDEYGFIVEDDEVTADIFETMGTLHQFITEKSAS